LVSSFVEKGKQGPGLINAGVYLINPSLFTHFVLPPHFSFEHDFLVPKLDLLKPRAFISEGYFIDIGVPEDYARAHEEFI
jgi:D-glycero-alpha-D-manno-heptose 1-phosphate guanylyltransferase